MPEPLNHLRCIRYDKLPVTDDGLYLLLDGALLNAPRLVYEHDSNPQLEQLYRGTRHASALEVSPCLVKPSIESQLWTEEHRWNASGIVLRSELPMAQLTDHLRSLTSAILPSGQLAYLRYYSPEWLLRLLSSCTAAEIRAFAGPISAWLIFRDNEWFELAPERTGDSRGASEEGWFAIRSAQLEQWEQEERGQFLERMAGHFGCASVDENEELQQRERLSQLIMQANEYEFDQEHLCIHYLELAWAFPDQMSSASIISSLADRTQTGTARLRQVEEQLFGLAREA